MKKIFFFAFILIIFFLHFFSALTLGISPGTIKISEKTNEIVCRNFTLLGDDYRIFNGEIKWSNENSKNLIDYKISSDSLGIYPQIPSEIKSGTYPICISSKNSGNYYGALMYKLNNSSYGIGAWIELNVNGEKFLSLTGKTTDEISYGKIFYFLPLLLIVILIFLLRKLKKKTEFN